jgi:hypothetical protein
MNSITKHNPDWADCQCPQCVENGSPQRENAISPNDAAILERFAGGYTLAILCISDKPLQTSGCGCDECMQNMAQEIPNPPPALTNPLTRQHLSNIFARRCDTYIPPEDITFPDNGDCIRVAGRSTFRVALHSIQGTRTLEIIVIPVADSGTSRQYDEEAVENAKSKAVRAAVGRQLQSATDALMRSLQASTNEFDNWVRRQVNSAHSQTYGRARENPMFTVANLQCVMQNCDALAQTLSGLSYGTGHGFQFSEAYPEAARRMRSIIKTLMESVTQ